MTNRISFTRRDATKAVLLTAASAFLPTSLLAETKEEALAFIQRLVQDINAVTNGSPTDATLARGFLRIFTRYSDIPILARSSLGVAWRSASNSQRTGFTNVLGTYLARKYGKKFRGFSIDKVSVSETRPIKGGYIVTSFVQLENGNGYQIEWQVVKVRGRDKMVNLYIEGLSLLAAERNEIADMLDARKGDLDLLIQDMREI